MSEPLATLQVRIDEQNVRVRKRTRVVWLCDHVPSEGVLPTLTQQLLAPVVNHLLRCAPINCERRELQVAAASDTDGVSTGARKLEGAIGVIVVIVVQAPQ